MTAKMIHPMQQSMDSLLTTTIANNNNKVRQVSMDEIRTKAFIGKGSFSKVYEVECKQRNGAATLALAMKCLDPKQVGKCPIKKDIATQDIEYESNILSRLDHPNIVKLHAVSPQGTKRQLPKRLPVPLSAPSSSSVPPLSSLMSSSSSNHRRSRSSSKTKGSDIGKYLVLELLEDTLDERLKRWRFSKKNKKTASASSNIRLQRRYSNGKKTVSRVLRRGLSFRSSRSANSLDDLAASTSSTTAAAAAAAGTGAADPLARSEVVKSIQRPNFRKSKSGLPSVSTSCHARLSTLTSDSTNTVDSLAASTGSNNNDGDGATTKTTSTNSAVEVEDDEGEQQLDRVRQVMPGLVSAIAYLHDKDLVFRDIKPQNVGFTSKSKVKLYDFGLCRKTNECSDDEIVGTFRYMAPERMVFRRKSLIRKSLSDNSVVIDEPSDDELKMPTSEPPQEDEPVLSEADVRKSNMLKAADVYGIGVLMWEVATLERPYQELLSQKNMMRSDLHVKLHRQGWRHNTEQIHCPKLRSLIDQCWNVDPNERPTMYEVCQALDDIFS